MMLLNVIYSIKLSFSSWLDYDIETLDICSVVVFASNRI